MLMIGISDKGADKAQQEQLWVLQARAGDRRAFARLAATYQTPIYNLAYRMLGDAAEAEDAAQEVFLRVYTRLHTYDESRKFASWILSIASHYCIDLLRRRRQGVLSLEEETSHDQIPDYGPRPEQVALLNEESERIRLLLETLPAEYRIIIVLRYWYDLSYTEIAEVLHTTESAVKSRLHRARGAMAKRMLQEPTQPPARRAMECRPSVRPAVGSPASSISIVAII